MISDIYGSQQIVNMSLRDAVKPIILGAYGRSSLHFIYI